jgi:hypothetical protein
MNDTTNIMDLVETTVSLIMLVEATLSRIIYVLSWMDMSVCINMFTPNGP